MKDENSERLKALNILNKHFKDEGNIGCLEDKQVKLVLNAMMEFQNMEIKNKYKTETENKTPDEILWNNLNTPTRDTIKNNLNAWDWIIKAIKEFGKQEYNKGFQRGLENNKEFSEEDIQSLTENKIMK